MLYNSLSGRPVCYSRKGEINEGFIFGSRGCFVLYSVAEMGTHQILGDGISDFLIQREQALGLVIADLHGFTYGKENKRLLEEMRRLNPDIIFIPGDMLVSKYSETYETALKTLKEFVKIAPVYYSYGNHESRGTRKESIIPCFRNICLR